MMADTSGLNMRESLARWDRATSSWRTCQGSLLTGHSDEFLGTWPTSGTMRNGQLYQRAPWVPHTHGSASSLLPTPTAAMGKRGFGLSNGRERYNTATVQRCLALT